MVRFLCLVFIVFVSCKSEKEPSDFRQIAVEAELNGNYDKALNYYNKAIRLTPQNDQYYYERSLLKGKMKNYSGAIRDMSKSIKIADSDEYLVLKLEERADFYIAINKLENAKNDLTKAISLDPGYSNYNQRAIVNLRLDNWNAAIKDCNEAILTMGKESDIIFKDAYFHKAIAYYNLGYKRETCFNYKMWKIIYHNDWKYYREDYYKKIFEKECK